MLVATALISTVLTMTGIINILIVTSVLDIYACSITWISRWYLLDTTIVFNGKIATN